MGFEFYKESYTGAVKEITLGDGDKAVTVGGETCYPFYQFEGDMPHKPKIAMEVWDTEPEDWAESAAAPFKDVLSDPAAWAKKCVDEYGADLIVLQLKSIDPNGRDAPADEAAQRVKKVAEAIDVPLVVWGCTNVQKDEEVLKAVAEVCQDDTLAIGPVEDKNHKGIGAAAMGYGHIVISSSPIDVNIAKQVNILLENLGMPMDQVIVDPTTGGLGYGLEYSYSVMERLRMAALAQGDDKLQYPIINNLANEVWKCKEAKEGVDEGPTMGDPEKRGILMEAVCAVSYLMAGSDVLIMRHPESARLIRSYIDLLTDGGGAGEIAAVGKLLDQVDIDYSALAPEPDLRIAEETAKAAPAKKEAAPAEKAKAVPAEKTEKKAAPKAEIPKKEAAPAAAAVGEPEAPAQKAEEEAAQKAREEAEKKAKEAAEKKAKEEAEAEKKVKAEAEKKAKAEAEKKAKEEAEKKAKAEAREKRRAEEDALRRKRAAEREKMNDQRQKTAADEKTAMTAAAEQKSEPEKILEKLQWIHRRVKLY